MSRRKPFTFRELPHLSRFRSEMLYAPEDVWSELYDLSELIGRTHPLGTTLLNTPSPSAVTIAEIEAWLQSKAPRDMLNSYLNLTLKGQISEAVRAAKQHYLVAHPDRAPKQGRPYLSGPDTRKKALAGLAIALLLAEAGEKVRRQCESLIAA